MHFFGCGRPMNLKSIIWCIILLFIMFSKISHFRGKFEFSLRGKYLWQFIHQKESNCVSSYNLNITFFIFISFEWHGWIKKNYFKTLNLPFEHVKTTRWLKCCGMEDSTVVAYGCGRQKKHERENVRLFGLALQKNNIFV